MPVKNATQTLSCQIKVQKKKMSFVSMMSIYVIKKAYYIDFRINLMKKII